MSFGGDGDIFRSVQYNVTVSGADDLERLVQAQKAVAEAAEAGGEAARLQAALFAMEQRSARDAAEAVALLGNATRTAGAAVHESAGDYQRTAEYHRAMAEASRQAARDEANLERQTRALDDALTDMAVHEATATRSHIASADASTKAGAAHDVSGAAARRGTSAMIGFAYAIDDAEYGLRGLGNNLVQLGTYIPGPWGGAIAVGVAGVVAFSRHAGDLAEALDIVDRTLTPIPSKVSDIEKYIKELEARPHKIAVEYEQIDKAMEKVERLKLSLAEAASMQSGLTKAQQARGRAFHEAVVEHAGAGDEATGLENVREAVIASMGQGDRDRLISRTQAGQKVANVREEIARAQRDLASPTVTNEEAGFLRAAIEKLQREELIPAERAAEEQLREAVSARIGSAGRGNTQDAAFINRLFQQNRGVFAAKGIGKDFGTGLAEASKEFVDIGIEAEKRRPADERFVEQQRKDAREAAAAIRKGEEQRDRQEEQRKAQEEKAFDRANDAVLKMAARTTHGALGDTEKQVEQLARRFGRAAQGPTGGDLDAEVASRLGAGQTADQIADAIGAAVFRRQAGVRDIPQDKRSAVARQTVRDRAAALADDVAARGAPAVVQDIREKQFDAARNEAQGDARRAEFMQFGAFDAQRAAMQRQQGREGFVARQMGQQDKQQFGNRAYQDALAANHTPRQATAIAHRTLNLMEQGFNLMQAEREAERQIMSRLDNLENKLKLQGHRGNTQRGTLQARPSGR